MASVEATGFRQLDEKLRQLPERMAREYLTEAVESGAESIRFEAARLAPRLTGDLATSIMVRLTKQRNTGGDPRAEIGPDKANAAKGRFQEFGTSRHGAQPFLRPALDNRGQEAIDRMWAVLAAKLEEESV